MFIRILRASWANCMVFNLHYFERIDCLTSLPFPDILQIVGNVVDHLFGEIFEIRRLHVDLQRQLE